MATVPRRKSDKETVKPLKWKRYKAQKLPTRKVILKDKDYVTWILHQFDDKCGEFHGTRTGKRSFTGYVVLQKKTKHS